MLEKSQETNVGTIQLIEDQIVRIQFKDRVDLLPEHMLVFRKIALDWTGNSGYCTYVVPGEFNTHSKEIKEVMALPENSEHRIAVAVHQSNLAVKIVVDLFWKVTKKKDPTRMFRTEQEALDWLRKCKDEYNANNNQREIIA